MKTKKFLLSVVCSLALSSSLLVATDDVDLDSNLEVYYDFQEDRSSSNILDQSGNNRNGVFYGDGITRAWGPVGKKSMKFDSVDYIEVKDSSAVHPVDNKFAISLWFRTESNESKITKEWMPIFYKGGDKSESGYKEREFTLWFNKAGYLHLASAASGKSQETYNTSEESIKLGRWYHLVAMIDREEGIARIYLNGKLALSQKDDYTNFTKENNPIYIGYSPVNSSSYQNFTGYMDDIRVYSSTLGEVEIKALYDLRYQDNSSSAEDDYEEALEDMNATEEDDGNATGISSGIVAHYTFDNNLNDASGFSNNGTPFGTDSDGVTGISYEDGVINQAAVFNGVNNCIHIKNNDKINFGAGDDFTISLFVNFDSNTFANVDAVTILEKWAVLSKEGYPFSFKIGSQNMGSVPYFGSYDLTKNPRVELTDFTPSTGEWHHVAYTKKGDEKITFYFDGSEVGSVSDLGLSNISNEYGLYIGCQALLNTTYNTAKPHQAWFKGKMDDLRIYNRELNGSEVADLYATKDCLTCGSTTDVPSTPEELDDFTVSSGWNLLGSSYPMDVEAVMNKYTAKKIFIFDGTQWQMKTDLVNTIGEEIPKNMGFWIYK